MAKNYDSEYQIQQDILTKLGGDGTKCFDSLYSILLEILDKIEGGGGGGAQIDDNVISTTTAWSSSKIVSELADAGFNVQVVQELPATGEAHTLYFVPSADPQTQNAYDEYLYANNAWEQVGSTAVDMSDYYTADEVDALLDDKVEIVEITQAEYDLLTPAEKNNGKIYSITDATVIDMNNYYTKTQADARYNPKNTVTARSGSFLFPNWNANGQITGYAAQAYQASQNINGSGRTIYSTSSSALPTIFAPTSAGTAGQYLTSNGSGAPIWKDLEVASDYVISDSDASAGTYSSDIAAFYTKTISENIVQGVQIKITDEHVVDNASVYSDSYYLPSSSRIYEGNVELWLMSTEDGQTWENIHYLITGNSITRDVTTGRFGQ